MNHDRAPRTGPPGLRIEERPGDLLGQLDVEALIKPLEPQLGSTVAVPAAWSLSSN